MVTLRRIIPLDSKSGVRKRGIGLSERLIKQESSSNSGVWKAIKDRIVYLMTNMDSLPHLNRIPIEKALNKVPSKYLPFSLIRHYKSPLLLINR